MNLGQRSCCRVLYLDFLQRHQLSLQQVRGFVDLTELAPSDLLLNPEVTQSAEVLTARSVFLYMEKNKSKVPTMWCIKVHAG